MLDQSMHKSAVSLGAGGGGKNRKEVVMVVSENNSLPTTNNEGVVAFLKEVSIVGMTLTGVVGPYGSW